MWKDSSPPPSLLLLLNKRERFLKSVSTAFKLQVCVCVCVCERESERALPLFFFVLPEKAGDPSNEPRSSLNALLSNASLLQNTSFCCLAPLLLLLPPTHLLMLVVLPCIALAPEDEAARKPTTPLALNANILKREICFLKCFSAARRSSSS